MEKITVSWKLETPLFMGGQDNESTVELREPGIKGALQFWWRALHYENDSELLYSIESLIFGSRSEELDQSNIKLKLNRKSTKKAITKLKAGKNINNSFPLHSDPEGLRYLGYGLINHHNKLERTCMKPPLEVELYIYVNKAKLAMKLDNADQNIKNQWSIKRIQKSLLDSIKALSWLGGWGSRSRRGFGSLSLQSITLEEETYYSQEENNLKDEIERLKNKCSAAENPKITALSSRSRFIIGRSTSNSPIELLDLIGKDFQNYRSYYGERNFEEDHDNAINLARGNRVPHNWIPDRLVFGLPHNYYLRSVNDGKFIRITATNPSEEKKRSRRASPLFISIQEYQKEVLGIITFLPSMFLSNGTEVSVFDGKYSTSVEEDESFWRPIDRYLDRIKNDKEIFYQVYEV